MNLVLITALIAVCSADKLDRTYLPPASAKTAGGSHDTLQTPLENSFNQGLGGLPKGSFTNDFQGVVVDAVSPGTRASGEGETGLGAPRIAYGSTNSKVGEAAFSSPVGFRQFDQSGFSADGQTADTNVSPQGFDQGLRGSQGFESKPERSQAARDRTASILRYESDIGTDAYNYAFETDNGISAEESGVATNGVQAHGGYSYTGDDGQVYSVTYTADEGGYQPRGDHLPTPPPIPEEILKSLEQNARDEAAGLIDDGSYDAQKYNAGGDYTDAGNGEHNARQPSRFGARPESDATASGTFINQNNQPIGTPTSNNLPGQDNRESTNVPSTFGSFNTINGFNQNRPTGAGSANEFVNSFQQNSRPAQDGKTQEFNGAFEPNKQSLVSTQENNLDTQSSGTFLNGDSNQSNAQGTPTFARPSINRPGANTQSSFNGRPTTGNVFSQSANNVNNFKTQSSNSNNGFGTNNEYLPPSNVHQNRRPSQNSFQAPLQSNGRPQISSTSATAFVSGSQNNADNSQDIESSQDNQFQFSNRVTPNRFSSTSKLPQSQTDLTSRPAFNRPNTKLSQPSAIFSEQSQQPTSQPQTELTTPFESTPNVQNNNADQQIQNFNHYSSQSTNGRPTQSHFENPSNTNGVFPVQSPTVSSASAFASTSTPQRPNFDSNSRPISKLSAGQSSQFSNQNPQIQQDSFTQNQITDVQFSSSTQRPTFSQTTIQAQGPDNSYYYNQPSKTFNTPISQSEGSRFPGQSQFNKPKQRPTLNTPQQNFPVNSFQRQNEYNRGSSRYPSPPTLAPIAPTLPPQGNAFPSFNGITQASASSFSSRAPTASTQFDRQTTQSGFSQRPTQQPFSQFSNAPHIPGQKFFARPTTVPQSFKDVSSSPFGQQSTSFQNQQSQFGQRPSANVNRPEAPKDDSSQTISSQQYDGEIYEYRKPAATLPAPTNTENSESEQSSQRPNPSSSSSRPQFGRPQGEQNSNDFTKSQPNQEISQFGVQQSRPQFVKNAQQSQFNNQIQPSRPEFGSQSVRPFDDIRPTMDNQFAQSTDGPKIQTNSERNQFNTANFPGSSQDTRPQFGLGQTPRPIGNIGQGFNNQQTSTDQFNKPCCTSGNSRVQPTQSSQFSTTQGFGTQDSGFTAQSFQPGQSSTQSFAGKGEVFGGPRKPPSFDQQTGYHY
ncbi:uncharacterized protein DDB_G0283357-like [Galleria mellonella]|uniref:Uncharacterized protein DDB_G0283357-like n=1 Tax=Galleria mellonella TaxID=7137 RepID=A0A6J1X835_GALME|nr:uncharacterized protein DDB_G0283357-like [Galleria mellonella]